MAKFIVSFFRARPSAPRDRPEIFPRRRTPSARVQHGAAARAPLVIQHGPGGERDGGDEGGPTLAGEKPLERVVVAWVSAAPARPVKKAMPAAATRDPARDTPTADATRMSQRAKGLRMTVKETIRWQTPRRR